MPKINIIIGLLFILLTLGFIILAIYNEDFFEWIFMRHQNQWSWYIRPLFLIPYCYFAFKKNFAGISIVLFCLFTSMFWFKKPDAVSDQVIHFLNFEKDWLKSTWTTAKLISVLLIPSTLVALAYSFWRRSLLTGIAIVVLIAIGKIIWSIQNAGDSGKSLIVPAIVGLIICSMLAYYGYRNLKNRK